MIELVVFLALAFAAVLVISVVGAVIGGLFSLLLLPFQLLGILLKGVGFLIVLPFLILGAVVIAAVVFGAGFLLLLAPLLPLVVLGALVWLLVRGGRRTATA